MLVCTHRSTRTHKSRNWQITYTYTAHIYTMGCSSYLIYGTQKPDEKIRVWISAQICYSTPHLQPSACSQTRYVFTGLLDLFLSTTFRYISAAWPCPLDVTELILTCHSITTLIWTKSTISSNLLMYSVSCHLFLCSWQNSVNHSYVDSIPLEGYLFITCPFGNLKLDFFLKVIYMYSWLWLAFIIPINSFEPIHIGNGLQNV